MAGVHASSSVPCGAQGSQLDQERCDTLRASMRRRLTANSAPRAPYAGCQCRIEAVFVLPMDMKDTLCR